MRKRIPIYVTAGLLVLASEGCSTTPLPDPDTGSGSFVARLLQAHPRQAGLQVELSDSAEIAIFHLAPPRGVAMVYPTAPRDPRWYGPGRSRLVNESGRMTRRHRETWATEVTGPGNAPDPLPRSEDALLLIACEDGLGLSWILEEPTALRDALGGYPLVGSLGAVAQRLTALVATPNQMDTQCATDMVLGRVDGRRRSGAP